jgi:signal transduction histidine kinase/CheY-like chemotaxis protein
VVFRIANAGAPAGAAHAGDGLVERRRSRLLPTQVDELLRSGTASLAGDAAVAIGFSAAYWWLAGDPRVLWWALGVLLALVVGGWQLWSYHRRGRAAKTQASVWLVRHLAALLLIALAWGAAPLLLLRESTQTAMLVSAMLFGTACVGAYSNAASLLAVGVWLFPVLGPLIVVMLRDSSPVSKTLGVLGIGFLITAIFFATRQHKLLQSAWRTKLDNDKLVRELRHQVVLVEQANREKSRFLGAASHDLRQPMHALGLFAAALEKSLARTPLRPTVANMMHAVDALDQSFNAMLDISKLDAGVVQPALQSFPIRDLFRRLHMQCAGQAEALGLGLRFKPGGKIVTSDPQLLERVLGNLIQNAIRYTRHGGVVVVARSRASRTCLEVWDTGIGIAEDELPKVFDEFYQVGNPGRDRTRGLGMGLAIVKRLVLLMGHELEVKSVPGRGTVFRLLLVPTEMADMENVVLGADTLPSPVDANQTVLMIDDEESIRVGTRELLQSWGYQVLLADSIAQARSAVLQHAGVIDVVVSDLRLANQEDGIDAIEQVRSVYGAPLPALLITGDTSADEVRRAHESGHSVLFKPVRTRDLYAALRSVP